MKTDICAELAEIRAKLDSIESHLIWRIKPELRFRRGQRVRFSKRAERVHLLSPKKLATRGTIKSINGFSVTVQLDGRKHPRSYHHAFFNPVSGPKLF